MENLDKSIKERVELPIHWNVPDDIVARYSTNMVVQRLDNEFLISFFEVKPPIILGDPDAIKDGLKSLKSIQANCVAQIIVAHDKLPSFINALQKNYKGLEKENMDNSDRKEE